MTRQFITEHPVVKSILFNSTNILIYQFVYYTNVNLPLLSHLPNQLHRNKETFSEKHSPSILILQGTQYPTDFYSHYRYFQGIYHISIQAPRLVNLSAHRRKLLTNTPPKQVFRKEPFYWMDYSNMYMCNTCMRNMHIYICLSYLVINSGSDSHSYSPYKTQDSNSFCYSAIK